MQNIFDEEPRPEDKYDLFKNDKPYRKKTLSKSKKDKVFFGICGGLADYYSMNSHLVRFFFALSIVLGGLGAVIYLLLFFIIAPGNTDEENKMSEETQLQNLKALLGIALITIGFYFIVMPANYFPFLFVLFIPMKYILPAAFLLTGIWMQKKYRFSKRKITKTNFKRQTEGKLFLGVCGGLADYLGTYAIVVRLLFVVFAFATLGVGGLIYFAAAFLIKQKSVVTIEQ